MFRSTLCLLLLSYSLQSHAEEVTHDPFGGGDEPYSEEELEEIIAPPGNKESGKAKPQEDKEPPEVSTKSYTNCISRLQSKNIPYGEAVKKCHRRKPPKTTGDILDVFPDWNKQLEVGCEDSKGNYTQGFIPHEDLRRIVYVLEKRNIDVQVRGQQVLLTAMSAAQKRVTIGQTTSSQWRNFMMNNEKRLPVSVKKSLGIVAPQIVRRIVGVVSFFVVPTMAPAASDSCSPYRSPEGFKTYLNLGAERKFDMLTQCPALNCELINLYQKIEGN